MSLQNTRSQERHETSSKSVNAVSLMVTTLSLSYYLGVFISVFI